MKAILEFNLPEDQYEFNTAIKGSGWKHVCWQMDQHLRKEIKYNDDNSDYKTKVLEKVRDELYGFMVENKVDLYEVE
tara:strand:+ start:260 stop:490 length:231 start_codon:yes stop_codon:yes gene_type:complete